MAAELYSVPPAQFVAARDEAVRHARDNGDRQLAARIGRLRRPTQSAWAVNLLVRAAAPQIEALLDLGDQLRSAQQRLHGEQLRRLNQQRRDAIGALAQRAGRLAADAGHPLSGPAVVEVEQTLAAALADQECARVVREGRLTRSLQHVGMGVPPLIPLGGAAGSRSSRSSGSSGSGSARSGSGSAPGRRFAAAPGVPEVPASSSAAPDAAGAADGAGGAGGAPDDEVARRRRRREQRRVRDLQRAATELEQAANRCERAEQEARRAEERAAQAELQLAELRKERDLAVREREEAQRRARSAARVRDDAQRRVQRLTEQP
ncbi:MAG TPA: hypothetical protein VGI84_09405 [Pseudonocardiaceae bacterium]